MHRAPKKRRVGKDRWYACQPSTSVAVCTSIAWDHGADRISKSAFSYPLTTEDAESLAKKLQDLVLMFGVPRFIRGGHEAELTVEDVQQLVRLLNMPIGYGPTDHPRTQGAVETLGWWIERSPGRAL